MFGSEKHNVTGEFGVLHNAKFCDLYRSCGFGSEDEVCVPITCDHTQ